MYNPQRSRFRQLTQRAMALALMFLLLASTGCSLSSSRYPTSPNGRITPTPQLADSLRNQGDTTQAAYMYAQLASEELNQQLADQYQLLATELYFDSELYADGLRSYDLLDAPTAQADPNAIVTPRRQLLDAYVELARANPAGALALVPSPRSLNDQTLRVRALQIQTRSHAEMNNPVTALKTRILIEANLTAPASITQNRVATRNMLAAVDTDTLMQMATVTAGSVYRGWIEYTLLQRRGSSGDVNTLAQQTQTWNTRYPGHPAAVSDVDPQYQSLQAAAKPISTDRVALILPLSGTFADVGKAIQYGFLAARFNSKPLPFSELRIYDSKSNTKVAVQQYETAVAEGASLIIGPLDKAAVLRLAASNRISMPTLSLNYTPNDLSPSPDLYQFGLLPEDEARDAAHYFLNGDLRKALVVVADNPLGDRLANAFSDTYNQNGGTTLGIAKVPEDSYDYSRQLKELLSINGSNARRRQLQKLLDTKIEFEPAIRGDVEAIFMAVDSEQARLLRPQLQFHHASHLPLVSTSRIFSGEVNPRADGDLNGVVYCEIPWVLPGANAKSALATSLTGALGESSHGLSKLQALGIDAWLLHTELEKMRFDRAYEIGGKAGTLTLGAGNRIRRRLQWLEFQEGEPKQISGALPISTVLPALTSTVVN